MGKPTLVIPAGELKRMLDLLEQSNLASQEGEALLEHADRILNSGNGDPASVQPTTTAAMATLDTDSHNPAIALAPDDDTKAPFRDAQYEARRRVARAQRATTVLDRWGIILPTRIFNEDLGGFVEDIHRRASEGQRCGVYLRVFAAMFWTSVNAFGYLLKQVGKTKSA